MMPLSRVENFDPFLSCGAAIKEVEITFADGKKKKIDALLLSHFPFFDTCLSSFLKEQTSGEITLSNFLEEHLNLLIELFYNNQHICSIIDEDSLCNPKFYDQLELIIRFFLAGEAESALTTIKEELRSLPYSLAMSLLHRYNKMPKNDPPFYVTIIEDLISQIIFFDDVEQYEEQFLLRLRERQVKIASNLLSCRVAHQVAKAADRKEKNCLSAFLGRFTHLDDKSKIIQDIYLAAISVKIKENIELTREIRHHEEKINPKKLTPLKLYLLSDQDCKLSNRYWKIYQEKVLDCLQYMRGKGAKMHKRALLYPKLFAYYDLIPKMHIDKNNISRADFTLQTDTKTHYHLKKQTSLKELEDEIRDDLRKSGVDLPERLFKNKGQLPSLKKLPPVSDEIQKHKELLIPYLCFPYKYEQQMCEEKNFLIKIWKWDVFEITSNDIEFVTLPEKLKHEDMIRVSGKLYKFGKELRFFFSLDTFKPIILDFKIDPTEEATHTYLEELYKKQNRSLKSKYNFFEK